MEKKELEELSKEELIEVVLQLLPKIEKIEQLEKRVEELEKVNVKLTADIKKYKNENTPSSAIPYYEKENTNNRHKQSGQREGHLGMSRKKPEKIDRIEELTLEISPCCHAPVERMNAEPKERTITVLLPPKLENVKYLKNRYICMGCGKEVQPQPPNTLSNSRFDLNFMILLSVLSVGMNLPFGKIKQLLKFLWRFDVSEATISNTLTKLGEFLGDDYEKLKKDIREAAARYDDETGWRVLGRGSWLWVFVSEKAALFTIEPSRGKKVVRKILGKGAPGVDVTDGLHSYDELESRKQKCWAHILRRFRQAVFFPFKNKREKRDFRRLRNSLKLIFKRAKEDKKNFGTSVKLREKYEDKLTKLLGKKFMGMNAEKILTTVRNQKNELFTFLEFDEVEPTNNKAEQALKAPIIKRKISYQSRSMRHARNYVMQLSIMKTAELRSQDYPEVLRDIVQTQSASGKF